MVFNGGISAVFWLHQYLVVASEIVLMQLNADYLVTTGAEKQSLPRDARAAYSNEQNILNR